MPGGERSKLRIAGAQRFECMGKNFKRRVFRKRGIDLDRDVAPDRLIAFEDSFGGGLLALKRTGDDARKPSIGRAAERLLAGHRVSKR